MAQITETNDAITEPAPKDPEPTDAGDSSTEADQTVSNSQGSTADAIAMAQGLYAALNEVVLGRTEVVRVTTAAIMSGGHLLIEDLPGTGKTLLAKSIAQHIGGSFGRIQCTPDVLPSDVLGTPVFDQNTASWSFRSGPIFNNIVLLDEINRASPRTQSALLEPMEERQVSIDGSTWSLPAPNICIATQNPFGHSGTFPLPQSQLDRFSVVIPLGRVDLATEARILSGVGGSSGLAAQPTIGTPESFAKAVSDTALIFVSEELIDYVVRLLDGARSQSGLEPGPSTRAGLSLLGVARGHAALMGRDYVTVDDVQAVFVPSLAHRSTTTDGMERVDVARRLEMVLSAVPVPRG